MVDQDRPRVVPVPGGRATLLAPDEVTERRRRPIKVAALVLGPRRMKEIYDALPTSKDVDPDELVIDLSLSRAEAEIMFELNDLGVLAVLKSWTLDRPVPTTVEQLQDLPAALYDALCAVATKAAGPLVAEALGAGTPQDAGFSLAAVGDETSPTGASGDSDLRSTPEAE